MMYDHGFFVVRRPIECLGNLVLAKWWGATDPSRRANQRQKDRLDLTRLVESHPRILSLVPTGLVPEIDQLRSPS